MIPTKGEGMPCPHCAYDLRGNVTGNCPECGLDFTVADVKRCVEQRRDRIWGRLSCVPVVWLACFFADGWLLKSGFLSDTLDRVENSWVKMTFLNVALHLFLASMAYLAVRTNNQIAKQVGIGLTVLLLAMIVGHIAISIATLL